MKRDDLPAPPVRDPAADAAWQRIYDAACAPYRRHGQWPYQWARGKLARDPAFRGMLERGDFGSQPRVVDIGCGQGLVAALLHACATTAARDWPAAWPPAPHARAYTGIELMQRDAERAQAALHALPLAPRFVCGDMCSTPLPGCDLVVILDVLHYVDHAAQVGVLQRVRDALREPGDQVRRACDAPSTGRLLLRVGDAQQRKGFAISQWVDRVVTLARGHRVAPTWGRPLAEWRSLLAGLGFADVQAVPMSQGTPFANVLLVADLNRSNPR